MSSSVRAIAPHLFHRRSRRHRSKPFDVSSPSSVSSAPSAPSSPLASTALGAPVPVVAATPDANTPTAAADPHPALLPAIIALAAAFVPAPITNIAQSFVWLVPTSIRTATSNFACAVVAVLEDVQDLRGELKDLWVELRELRRARAEDERLKLMARTAVKSA